MSTSYAAWAPWFGLNQPSTWAVPAPDDCCKRSPAQTCPVGQFASAVQFVKQYLAPSTSGRQEHVWPVGHVAVHPEFDVQTVRAGSGRRKTSLRELCAMTLPC